MPKSKYTIPSWRDYQHYKDRNPPWIKLHYELLSSRMWVTLDDASRVLAVACMLIASRNNGDIPDDDTYVQRVAYLSKKPNYKPLIDCGFLVYASTLQADASTLQADASTLQADARPEEEKSTEKKKIGTREENVLPDWLPRDAWSGYVEMRQKIKKPLTARAITLAIGKLEGFKKDGYRPEDVLNQSILNCWQNLYAPKGVEPTKPQPTAWKEYGLHVEMMKQQGTTCGCPACVAARLEVE